MTKSDNARGSANASANPEAVFQSMEQGRQEAAHAWSRACHLYAHYFTSLGKAETPAAVLQANVDLFSGSMENLGQSVSALQQMTAR